MESEHIEPGLLSVFRLVIGLQFGITLVALFIIKFLRPELNLATLILWVAGWMGLLLVYLSWPMLQRRMGRWYLPIALSIATVSPMLPRMMQLYTGSVVDVPLLSESEIISNGWRLLLGLLLPLVFVAWQYQFRAVFIYSVAITLLNLATGVLSFGPNSTLWPELVDQSLTGGVIFLVIGYVIMQLVRSQHEKQRALAEANAQLVDLASTAEQLAISRERNRLARDLHDTLAHTLSAVSVQLEAIDSTLDHSPEQVRPMLAKTQASARGGLAETRRALRALRASPLDDLGLALAVRTLAEATAIRNGLGLKINIPNELNLPPELEQNVYRIVQEAIENVIQHANARNLTISIDRHNGATILEIQDDGRGFQPNDMREDGHYGLQGMEERANLIGAKLDVISRPGQGTTVRLTKKRD